MPSRNHVIIKKHIVKNQLRDIDLNAFLKVVEKQLCTYPSITILTRFGKNIMQNNFHENQRNESELFNFVILN